MWMHSASMVGNLGVAAADRAMRTSGAFFHKQMRDMMPVFFFAFHTLILPFSFVGLLSKIPASSLHIIL